MKPPAIAQPAHLEADLKTLQLPAVAASWRRLTEEATRTRRPYPEYLADLVSLEVAGRRERRIERRMSEARFPVLKTLDAFDFSAQPALDREQVLELARGDFVDAHRNVVLVGGVGTGKTHLAVALGVACCQRERRVRFVTAAELTNALVEAKAAGRLSRKVEQFARFDVVIVDELGYVPFDKQGADLLFGFIARVYERRSLIVTTNLAFAQWDQVFLDATAAAAVIDRVMHHASILKTEGTSFRLKQAREGRPQRKEASAS
jgi:DNA replication protein DnaC